MVWVILPLNTDVLGTEVIVPLLFVPEKQPLVCTSSQAPSEERGHGLGGCSHTPALVRASHVPVTSYWLLSSNSLELVGNCWPGVHPARLGAETIHPTSLPWLLALIRRLQHHHHHC